MAKCKYPNEVCANMTMFHGVAYCDTVPCQLSGESEKYYWRLNISEIDEDSTHYIYLNIRKYNNLVWISNKNENEHFRTRFSEEEYKELSEKYSFPFNMFVKEEMEE